MSRTILYLLLFLIIVLLSACGTNTSWEDEKVAPVSPILLSDEVQATWTVGGNESSGSEEGKRIRIEIKKKDGTPIDRFKINHEKLLHLIVISKDLSYFNHVHPEYIGNGVFEIANDFPAGGEYRLIADFKPEGANSMSKMEWVQVEGQSAEPVPVEVDANLSKVSEGIQVKLTMDQPAAGEELTLKFSFADAATGQPITDLQPYLGAIGHVVVLSQDGEQYLHVHADEGQGEGPDATFETSFPRSGIYKIWGQFQRDNQVFTVSYVVNVPV
ncbi:hypothetical protein U9M73_21935 [Paenibacillus phoenicis]|uniref:YtkA-like domain-containing protein n=1 Tax=Paenibacillus phoenicis TaxID=554117 RepID=A0ABU5PRL5_9BACL|nr:MULTISPECIES: hypothetical protein [Paenibacillus]MEA3572593.1 hypothetical protein [Paenibacillus phoenicis]MEC2343079.1 hypothetical protein [Paenibacillus barengoltzii]